MEKIRLGIIGIGNMGTGHASNVVKGSCPDFILSAIADINPDRLNWAKEKFGDEVTYFDDASDMIKSGLIDAAIVHPVRAPVIHRKLRESSRPCFIILSR